MMTSNLFVGDSDQAATGASASEISNPKRKRLFIADLFYLKRLFARRKFEANPFTKVLVQQRFGDWRHPAHPIVVEVRLVHAYNPVAGFAPVGLANCDVGSEAHNVSRSVRRFDDFRRVQTFLELQNPLIE